MATPNSPTEFCGLPPEIRNRIYELLFTAEGHGAPLDVFQTSDKSSLAFFPVFEETDAAHREIVLAFLNLSRTCRQLYDEVRGTALLYKYNTIRICTSQQLCLQEREKRAVTSIHFVFHPKANPEKLESELATVLGFPNLKKLTLEIAFDFFRLYHGLDDGIGLTFKPSTLHMISGLKFYDKLGKRLEMFELRMHILKYSEADDYPIWSERAIYGRGWHDMVSWRSSRDQKEWKAAVSNLIHVERNMWQAFHAGVAHDSEYRNLEWQLKERVLKPEVLEAEMTKRLPFPSLD